MVMEDLTRRVERLEQLLRVAPLESEDSIVAMFDQIRRFHVEMHRRWAGSSGRTHRAATVIALHNAGWSLDEIARTGGFSSRERVRQILKSVEGD